MIFPSCPFSLLIDIDDFMVQDDLIFHYAFYCESHASSISVCYTHHASDFSFLSVFMQVIGKYKILFGVVVLPNHYGWIWLRVLYDF